jgi:uncharacterized protein (DUF1499 family)
MQTIIKRMVIMGIWASLLSACAGERPQTLGVRNGQLSPCPSSPNCVHSQGSNDKHSIAPLSFNGGPVLAWQDLRALLTARTDTSIVAEEPNYLRVEFRTTFFIDDGEFLLNEEGRQIEMRSASRVGYSDLGKNRARLEEIRRGLEKERSSSGK